LPNVGNVGSSDVDVRTVGAKTLNFSKFMVCPHGKGMEMGVGSEEQEAVAAPPGFSYMVQIY